MASPEVTGNESGTESESESENESDDEPILAPWEKAAPPSSLEVGDVPNDLDVTIGSISQAAISRLKRKGLPYCYEPVEDIDRSLKEFVERIKSLTGYNIPVDQPIIAAVLSMAMDVRGVEMFAVLCQRGRAHTNWDRCVRACERRKETGNTDRQPWSTPPGYERLAFAGTQIAVLTEGTRPGPTGLAPLMHLLYYRGKPFDAFASKSYSKPLKQYIHELPSVSSLNLWPSIVIAWFERCMELTTGVTPKHGSGALALCCNALPKHWEGKERDGGDRWRLSLLTNMISAGFLVRYGMKHTRKHRHSEHCKTCGNLVVSPTMDGIRAHMFICKFTLYCNEFPADMDLDPTQPTPFHGLRKVTCGICTQTYPFHPEGYKRHLNTCFEIWANPPLQQTLGFFLHACPICKKNVYLPGVKVTGELNTSVPQNRPPDGDTYDTVLFEDSKPPSYNRQQWKHLIHNRRVGAWRRVVDCHERACRRKGTYEEEWMTGALPTSPPNNVEVIFESVHADAVQTLMGASDGEPVLAIAEGVYQTTNRTDLADSIRVTAALMTIDSDKHWKMNLGNQTGRVEEVVEALGRGISLFGPDRLLHCYEALTWLQVTRHAVYLPAGVCIPKQAVGVDIDSLLLYTCNEPGAWPGVEALYYTQTGTLPKVVKTKVQFPSAVVISNILEKSPFTQTIIESLDNEISKHIKDLMALVYVPDNVTTTEVDVEEEVDPADLPASLLPTPPTMRSNTPTSPTPPPAPKPRTPTRKATPKKKAQKKATPKKKTTPRKTSRKPPREKGISPEPPGTPKRKKPAPKRRRVTIGGGGGGEVSAGLRNLQTHPPRKRNGETLKFHFEKDQARRLSRMLVSFPPDKVIRRVAASAGITSLSREVVTTARVKAIRYLKEVLHCATLQMDNCQVTTITLKHVERALPLADKNLTVKTNFPQRLYH